MMSVNVSVEVVLTEHGISTVNYEARDVAYFVLKETT